MRARALYHLARADFMERTRRHSFRVTLGLVLYLAYAVHRGELMLRLGRYRGVLDSAWVGGMMTLVITTLLSLAGFFLVKNAIERDRLTGVGQILATTPTRRPEYTLAKTWSNFVFLAVMVAILAAAAVVMQLAGGEERRLEPGALLAPFVWVALPCMLLVSALAVLFEAVPWLSGGAGNVLYFFLWSGGLTASVLGAPGFDFSGFRLIGSSMQAAAHAAFPDYGGGIDLTFAGLARPEAGTFDWSGIRWTPAVIAGRFWFVAVAIGLALLAALPFDRFDPARGWGRPRRTSPSEGEEEAAAPAPAPASRLSAATLSRAPMRPGLAPLLFAEIRLFARAAGRRWLAIALGLVVASLASPMEVVRSFLLPIAWIWPVLLWSGMGTRERRHNTEPLIYSGVRPISRQLPALWLAGVVVSVATGLGAGLRLAISGDAAGFVTWIGGAVFIPSLALALGAWSGSSRPFESIYVALWYIGPFRRTAALDFIGTTHSAERMATTGMFFLVSVVLVLVAVAGRRWRLTGGSG